MKKQGYNHSLEGGEKCRGLLMSVHLGEWHLDLGCGVERFGSMEMKLVRVPVEKGFLHFFCYCL